MLLGFQVQQEGLAEQILDFIYLDLRSLTRFSATSKELRRHCAEELRLRWRRVLHIDLTAEVEVDVPQDVTANVLEVTISRGVADRCNLLGQLLQRCTNLQHIHLQLVPDPGWLLVDRAQSMDDDELLEFLEAAEVSQGDSVALLYAKLWLGCPVVALFPFWGV